uniref:DUF3715 domain-containing protein n=1 Tax=Pygocentrus nattereri TaxID=42514 RepID=A0A3B4DXG2_PYGNA
MTQFCHSSSTTGATVVMLFVCHCVPAVITPVLSFGSPGLLQMLAPDSREFEELVKVLSSFYLDTSSRGAFTYTKACLIHNELLEKEVSSGFRTLICCSGMLYLLLQTHWICEKGLSVGHARISNLGNPSKGVYLSKYSDLLQINPFEAGASGDIIVFKVMKGRLKSIFENMPKSNLEPAPKFDCHVHKNASKVTSLLSYRAFELTQQYFYEFAFEELRSRPRHVFPYAVVSFQYKDFPFRIVSWKRLTELCLFLAVRRRYTVWSGLLVNKGEELYQVCILSKHAGLRDSAVPLEPKDPIAEHLDTFVPALHHAFFKLRSNPPKDVAAGVKNQALDYLGLREQGVGRPFVVPEYRMNLDEWPNLHPSPRPKGMDSALNAYMYGPARFQLPVVRLQQGLVDSGQGAGTSPPGGGGEEYSPVSDWGGSDRASGSGRPGPAPAQSNGSAQRPRPSQAEYDKEKMEKLLKLIQLHKRALGKEDSSGQERSEDWDPAGLKRRLEDDGSAGVSKYLNTGLLSNGDLSGCIEALMSVYMELMFLLFWLIQFSLSVPDSVGDEAASGADRPGQAAGRTLDSILDQEFQNLCTGIRELMDSQQILYVSQPPPPRHEGRANGLESTFSPYVSNYISPPTVQTYVNTLCEKMNRMIHSPGAPPNPAANAATPTVAAHPSPVPVTSPLPSPRLGTVREMHLVTQGKKTDPKLSNIVDSPKCLPSVGSTALPPLPELPPGAAQAGGSNVIGQIKPEVLSTLVEIMQMNTVRFYIQRGDQDENQLCTEIKRYLESLGNIECNPQTYLENNCQQKFMVIIQNEDIASHVHKIPALVSLKKLPTVYFAGVDSLDDVKNRTYNELFVSGGLVVSDELILNPDYITLEKLQAFLQLLEKQNMSWKWKVHCKTQKKLKELSRLNTEALELLNLLTVYQKKHLVEFLPYHECDAPSKQAPDLDCLVKLQAQHTQLRHIIFLTDKCFDVPKFSSNGVIIASITDIMTNFESLVSSAKAEVPAVPILSAPGTTMSTSAANHPSDFI